MIRTALLGDLPDIVAIYNEAVEERFATGDLRPVTTAERTVWFHEHDPSTLPIYLFEEEGAVAGWCSLSAYRPGREAFVGTAEISYYLRRTARGRGIGSALVRHAVSEAPRTGKRVLFAILLEKNAASARLMERCGFSLWGRLPDVASIDGELVSHLYYGRRV